MLCDRCKKNEAKVYYTEIVNKEKTEQHLCEECAMEFTSFQMGNSFMNQEMTLGSLLSTILGNHYINESQEEKQREALPSCHSCGMTYTEFMKIGRFSCSQCYDSFAKALDKSITSIQGSNQHTGKKPKGFKTESEKIVSELSEVEKLSIRLQDAIEKEEYEEAASLRDRIRVLKKEEIGNA